MSNERLMPEAGQRSPEEIHALLMRLHNGELSEHIANGRPIQPTPEPLSEQEPRPEENLQETIFYQEPKAAGAEETASAKPATAQKPLLQRAENQPRTLRARLKRALGTFTLTAVALAGGSMVYAGAKPYYDEYKAAKDFTQKAKATPSMLPSVPTKESPSPSAIPTIESPSPTPEVLQHPIDAQWIVLNHGGEMLQVPVVDRPAEIVKNWHIEGSPETTNLPAPTGNIVGPDGVEYNDKQYVVRWQEGPKIGSQGPAIITGHNVSDGLGGPSGAGVFDYLPQAKEGATMAVIGLDSNNQMTKLTYRAVKIVPFSKGDLNGVPNALAQMPKGVTFTAVTCAGDFTNNQATGETSHDGNAAVGYELVAVEPM